MYCLSCMRQTRWLKTKKRRKNDDGIVVDVWKCGTCGGLQNGYVPHKRQQPRELYFDIETAYNVCAVSFDLKVRSGYISPDAIIKPSYMLCWAAGWVGEKEMFSACVTAAESKRGDDKRIVSKLWQLLNEADVVIGHNSDRFDVRQVNYRLWLYGLEPPKNYKTVDTVKVSRKNFAAESHKMDYLSKRKGGPEKHKMELQDWLDCMAGNQEALDKMAKYNLNDVTEGKALYESMLPWIPVQHGQPVRMEMAR